MISEIGSDKLDELIKTSRFKARFCELLSGISSKDWDTSKLYTLGMFSLIDEILDQSMKNIMEKLPLSKDLARALVNKEGDLSEYIRLIEAYEDGNWD